MLFKRTREKSDIESIQIDEEVKQDLRKAADLALQVRKDIKASIGLDLTCRLQLQDDCERLERLIDRFCSGKDTPKMREELKRETLSLWTTSFHILYKDDRPF